MRRKSSNLNSVAITYLFRAVSFKIEVHFIHILVHSFVVYTRLSFSLRLTHTQIFYVIIFLLCGARFFSIRVLSYVSWIPQAEMNVSLILHHLTWTNIYYTQRTRDRERERENVFDKKRLHSFISFDFDGVWFSVTALLTHIHIYSYTHASMDR